MRSFESWPLVTAEDSGPKKDLCVGFELQPSWTQDFLDHVHVGGGDAQVFQRSPKPVGGDRSFGPEGLHLVHISVHPFDLGVALGRVLFISLVFYVMVLQLLLLLHR
jgi:hypothetical protein